MKKIFLSLTAIVVIIVVGIYGVLFTKPGNSFVASIIEDKVNEGQEDVNLKVNDFTLTFSTLVFKASVDDNSDIEIQGDLNIFAKSVDLSYDINIKDLAKLQNLTKQKINGSFSTKGTIKGDQKFAKLVGQSKIASSDTSYDVSLIEFIPKEVIFKMQNAKVEELLHLVDQPKYVNALLSIDANIKNADINSLDGIIKTTLKNGVLNTKVLNSDSKDTLNNEISFLANSETQLLGNIASTKFDFDSSIAKINIEKADYDLKKNSLLSDYSIFVKSLSKLEPLINQKLNGNFTANGDVEYKNNDLKLIGTTDIFKSKSNYTFATENSKPKSLKLNMKDAQLSYILNLLNQPKFTAGLLDIDANIKNLDFEDLDGKVITKIKDGLVNNNIVNKQFDQKLKDEINFTANVNTDLQKSTASSIVDINSSLANLDMQKAIYNLKDFTFTSDYKLNINDLSKLYDVTAQKMRGEVSVNGNIKQSSDEFRIDGETKIFDGDINFLVLNDTLTANIKNVEVKDLLHMTYYPEIFTSKSDIKVNFNTKSKIGKITGKLIDGQFINNEFSTLINNFTKFDLTSEIYNTVDIESKIDNEIINTIIDMQSKNTTIKVENSTLNTKESSIDALVKTKINKYDFDTKIKGKLSSPKINIDTSEFIKNEAKDKIKEKINEKLGDKIKDSILKDLFNKAPNYQQQIKKPATNEEIARAFKEMFGEN